MKDRNRKALIAESVYVRNDGYRQTDRELVLSKELRIPFKAGDLWVRKQGRLELHYDRLRRKWYGRIPVEVKWPRKREPHKPTPKRASVDLGICNLAACAVEGSKTAYVYSGRAVLSDWRYLTKRIAKRQMQLAKVNGKRTSKTLRGMLRARKRRLDHAVDAMVRDLYERLEEQGVTKVIIGDLKHIRENADHGKVGYCQVCVGSANSGGLSTSVGCSEGFGCLPLATLTLDLKSMSVKHKLSVLQYWLMVVRENPVRR
jgi:putative transposase